MQTDLLAGIRILVTRPVQQAQAFCDMLTEQAGQVIRLPAIEIEAIELSAEMTAMLENIEKIDFAFFISPNAVELGLAALLAHGKIPDKLKLVTIGKASAQKMQKILARAPDIYPIEQYNSEALLALDSLQSDSVNNKKIIIFRGQGGRELLAASLKHRGAEVEYVELYCRKKPRLSNRELETIWGFDRKKPDIVTVTSNEGLDNLLAMHTDSSSKMQAAYQAQLQQTALVVVTEAMRTNAQKQGFNNTIMIAAKASNEALLASVLEWAKIRKR